MITFLVEKWIRESVAKGCYLLIVFLGYTLFLYTMRPVAANVHFPFHIRTFQVVPVSGEGQGHSYEPRDQTIVPAFTLTPMRPFNHNNTNSNHN